MLWVHIYMGTYGANENNWWLYLIGIILIVISISVSMYNKFVAGRLKVKQARGAIDIYLKQRFDLIPNMVDTVKAYAKHEKQTLARLVEIRASYLKTGEEDMQTKATLYNESSNLIALVEANPNLKSNENYLKLQKVLEKIESQLQAARRIYNVEVTDYNTLIQKVPNNIFAKIYKAQPEKLFEINETERENVTIS